MIRPPPISTLFPYTTLFRSGVVSVAHDRLFIPEDLQGKGLSKELFRSLYKQYGNAGVERISVHANMEVGGYTWCKYGFQTYNDRILTKFIDKTFVDEKLNLEVKGIVSDYYKINEETAYFPMNLLSKYKEQLLNSSWFGHIDLTNAVQREIFENYMNFKK